MASVSGRIPWVLCRTIRISFSKFCNVERVKHSWCYWSTPKVINAQKLYSRVGYTSAFPEQFFRSRSLKSSSRRWLPDSIASLYSMWFPIPKSAMNPKKCLPPDVSLVWFVSMRKPSTLAMSKSICSQVSADCSAVVMFCSRPNLTVAQPLVSAIRAARQILAGLVVGFG